MNDNTITRDPAEAWALGELIERIGSAGHNIALFIKHQRAVLPAGVRPGSDVHNHWMYTTYGAALDVISVDNGYTAEHHALARRIMAIARRNARSLPAKRGATAHIVGQLGHAVTELAAAYPGVVFALDALGARSAQ